MGIVDLKHKVAKTSKRGGIRSKKQQLVEEKIDEQVMQGNI